MCKYVNIYSKVLNSIYSLPHLQIFNESGDRHGRDRMIVVFTTTYAISTYHHLSCEFESRSWQGTLDTTFCDKVCQ